MKRLKDAAAWVVFPALFLLGAICLVVDEGFDYEGRVWK